MTNQLIFRNLDMNNELSQSSLFEYFFFQKLQNGDLATVLCRGDFMAIFQI